MNGLERRVDALEQIAEQARRREIRETIMRLPEARGLTPDDLERATDEFIRCEELIASWRRAGCSERQIMQRWADQEGLTVAELEAQCLAILEA